MVRKADLGSNLDHVPVPFYQQDFEQPPFIAHPSRWNGLTNEQILQKIEELNRSKLGNGPSFKAQMFGLIEAMAFFTKFIVFDVFICAPSEKVKEVFNKFCYLEKSSVKKIKVTAIFVIPFLICKLGKAKKENK